MLLVCNVMNGLFDLGHNELIRLINGPILYSPAIGGTSLPLVLIAIKKSAPDVKFVSVCVWSRKETNNRGCCKS